MNTTNALANLPAKLLACALALVLLTLGAVGLILPIIPGLLFLALAAIVLVKGFPSLEALVRQHRSMDRHLDRVDRMRRLSLGSKLRVAGLLCVKVLLDGLTVLRSAIQRTRD